MGLYVIPALTFSMSDEPRSPSPLDYATRLPPDTRTSKLAIVALVASVLCSPCLLGPLSDWINWYVPQQFNQVGRYGYVHQWTIFGAMIVATALSVCAVTRIRLAQGRLLGAGAAWAALCISLLWWGLLVFSIILLFFYTAG